MEFLLSIVLFYLAIGCVIVALILISEGRTSWRKLEGVILLVVMALLFLSASPQLMAGFEKATHPVSQWLLLLPFVMVIAGVAIGFALARR